MYRYFKDTAKIKRPVLADWKSSYQLTGITCKWFLKPISSEDSLYQDRFWQDFNFHTNDTIDIKTTDILEIEWEDYQVKWVGKTIWIIIKYRKVLLTKSK